MKFRSFLFWLHLIAGLISGLAIGLMCFTGTVLAFEKELVAWWERDARRVEAPAAGAARLPLAELEARFRAAEPEARVSSLVLQNDPTAAPAFSAGRGGGYYVNPYTGEVRRPASTAMSGFMHTMTDLHRYLGFHGEQSRPIGKLINGVCNLAFFVLAVTGLYLWVPRVWSWRTIRPVLWFRRTSSAKARDFNWHNAIGLWSAPVLIVLTLTAVPISFRWGGDLIYKLTGTPAPAASPTAGGAPGEAGPGRGGPGRGGEGRGGPARGGPGRGGPGGPVVAVAPPGPGATLLDADAIVGAVARAHPDWRTLTLRLGFAANQAATVTVRERSSWPRTATTSVSVNPYTGEIAQRSGYAEMNAAQQVRSWTRFLHTGEALGWAGQFVAGLACLGGVFLVYTGFALSWRRFFGRPAAADPAPEAASQPRETRSSAGR